MNGHMDELMVFIFNARTITGVVSAKDSQNESFTSRGVRYIEPKKLNSFASIRQNCHAGLLRMGTRFLGGYAISAKKADKAAAFLTEKAKEWETEKNKLITHYNEWVSEWVSQHPELLEFEQHFPSLAWIDKFISFQWTAIQIAPTTVGARGLDAMIGELPVQILEEIATDVCNSWTSSQRMTARTRGLIERIAQKLESLSFLGGKLGPMARQLRSVLQMLPTEGTFAPAEAALAGMVLAMLSSPTSAADLLTLDPKSVMSVAETPAPAPEPVFSFEETAPTPVNTHTLPAMVAINDDEEFYFSMS